MRIDEKLQETIHHLQSVLTEPEYIKLFTKICIQAMWANDLDIDTTMDECLDELQKEYLTHKKK